ncbi:uncharacterized protein LOC127003571 isoform X2 [Eriocheir sinensis]|uniref:uncharacterized protein LOC127003571 isoform X2 n=1 Tax=Eriocheir sinensis TaxID=95602 RepID=UPI0021C5BE82|nr:uncharacterized protein LOC127003571 isoform X2 [Eriocheir sinensis]
MMQVVVVSRVRAVPKNRPLAFVGLSLLMAIVAGINLGVGTNISCYNDYYCDYRRRAYIISGSCFVVSAVCFLIAAISLHMKIKKAERMNATNPPRPPVTVAAYPSQPVAAYPAMQTQYPPPYPPPGTTTYTLGSPGVQYQAPIGFSVAQQPTQSVTQGVSQPPAYAP